MNFHKTDKKAIEINIIPIINIVFLLLIFFIAAGTLKNNDVIAVNAPVSTSGSEVASDPIEIIINRDDIIINLELVSQKDLGFVLNDLLATDPETEIMLKADAKLPATRLVEILQLIRKANGKNLYLVTEGVF